MMNYTHQLSTKQQQIIMNRHISTLNNRASYVLINQRIVKEATQNEMFLVVAIGCSFLLATNPVFTCVFLT